jgi:phage/plasmid-like protein (TIGR03299 family)
MKAVEYDLKGAKTAAEALDTAELAWEGTPTDLVTVTGINIEDHRAIIRSDNQKSIGIVGKRYTPLQNSYAFSFLDTLCDQYNAKYDKAFVLDGGHKVILEVTLTGALIIRKGDEVLKKIRLINTFDGSYPFIAQFIAWRKICKNGLMGWARDNKCIVYHTKNAESKADAALRVLASSESFFKKFEQKCKELSNKILDKKMIDAFFKAVDLETESTRKSNQREKVEELFHAGKGTGKGTAWDIFNGYVEWLDHFRTSDPETQLANSILGANYMKEHAFEVAINL